MDLTKMNNEAEVMTPPATPTNKTLQLHLDQHSTVSLILHDSLFTI
jgi:hypothetical protein